MESLTYLLEGLRLVRHDTIPDDKKFPLVELRQRACDVALNQLHLFLSDEGLFLVFADLDDLKIINDAFGHQAGDQALRDAARVFRETFRETDIIARVGGDEFAVFPVGAVEAGTMDIIHGRLQKQLYLHNTQAGRRYKLSFSLGMAYFDPERPCSLDELLLRSDKLMYDEKRRHL